MDLCGIDRKKTLETMLYYLNNLSSYAVFLTIGTSKPKKFRKGDVKIFLVT